MSENKMRVKRCAGKCVEKEHLLNTEGGERAASIQRKRMWFVFQRNTTSVSEEETGFCQGNAAHPSKGFLCSSFWGLTLNF